MERSLRWNENGGKRQLYIRFIPEVLKTATEMDWRLKRDQAEAFLFKTIRN